MSQQTEEFKNENKFTAEVQPAIDSVESSSESCSFTQSVSLQNDSSNLNLVNKTYLKEQLRYIRKDLDKIQINIESQLASLKQQNSPDTDDIEARIMMKINWINDSSSLKNNPTCCSLSCLII